MWVLQCVRIILTWQNVGRYGRRPFWPTWTPLNAVVWRPTVDVRRTRVETRVLQMCRHHTCGSVWPVNEAPKCLLLMPTTFPLSWINSPLPHHIFSASLPYPVPHTTRWSCSSMIVTGCNRQCCVTKLLSCKWTACGPADATAAPLCRASHTRTHTTILWPSWILSGTTRGASTRKVKPIWIYWSKRYWVAVASAGPYANLHLKPRHVTTPASHHSVFYGSDALPAAKPTFKILKVCNFFTPGGGKMLW